MNVLLFWLVAALRARDYRWGRCHRSMWRDADAVADRMDGRESFTMYTERLGWWCSLWPMGGGPCSATP